MKNKKERREKRRREEKRNVIFSIVRERTGAGANTEHERREEKRSLFLLNCFETYP